MYLVTCYFFSPQASSLISFEISQHYVFETSEYIWLNRKFKTYEEIVRIKMFQSFFEARAESTRDGFEQS